MLKLRFTHVSGKSFIQTYQANELSFDALEYFTKLFNCTAVEILEYAP
jgi:hypothetical protein